MAVCPECSNDNPSGMLFCSACGANLKPGLGALAAADRSDKNPNNYNEVQPPPDSPAGSIQDEEELLSSPESTDEDRDAQDAETPEPFRDEASSASPEEHQSAINPSSEPHGAPSPPETPSDPLEELPEAYDRGLRSPLVALSKGQELGDGRWWLDPTVEAPKPEPVDEAVEHMPTTAPGKQTRNDLPDLQLGNLNHNAEEEEEGPSSTGWVIALLVIGAIIGAFTLL